MPPYYDNPVWRVIYDRLSSEMSQTAAVERADEIFLEIVATGALKKKFEP